MIDEFVARVKSQYQGLSVRSMSNEIGGMNEQAFQKFSDVLDVYGCAWYSMVASPYGLPPNTILDRFYSDIPVTSMIDTGSLNCLLTHIKDNALGISLIGSDGQGHSFISIDHVMSMFIRAATDVKFEFYGWMDSNAAMKSRYIPLGLISEKFLAPEFLNRHASNVGVILNWDASFIDIDNNQYKSMVIDRWPIIIERLMKRFGGDKKKLPRFCYGFNDFYLLRPVAISILRGKQVPDEIYKWFCLWQFRRIWSTTPSDKLFAKAVCKSWERFREVVYQEGYKRSHLFNCLMRILHELKEVPITREQLGDVYPALIRAALKKKDKVAASFLQLI